MPGDPDRRVPEPQPIDVRCRLSSVSTASIRAAMAAHACMRPSGPRGTGGWVERLTRQHDIQALARHRFWPTTIDSRHQLPIAPNLLQQKFALPMPNRVWLADMTYIPTGEGWLYMAAVLDLATRKVVGWAMRDHMRVELVLAALIMAAQRQRPWSYPSQR
jgi:putative transposase